MGGTLLLVAKDVLLLDKFGSSIRKRSVSALA